jgi:hypothetical protein
LGESCFSSILGGPAAPHFFPICWITFGLSQQWGYVVSCYIYIYIYIDIYRYIIYIYIYIDIYRYIIYIDRYIDR